MKLVSNLAMGKRAEREHRLEDALRHLGRALADLNPRFTGSTEDKREAYEIYSSRARVAERVPTVLALSSDVLSGGELDKRLEPVLMEHLGFIAFNNSQAGRLAAETGDTRLAFRHLSRAVNIYSDLDERFPAAGFLAMAEAGMEEIAKLRHKQRPPSEEPVILETFRS